MNTQIRSILNPTSLHFALKILRSSGLIAFPTDTVYGLGAMAFDEAAVSSIFAAKDRPAEKAIPILIGDQNDLEKVAIDIPGIARTLAARFWPGPLTLVINKNPQLPQSVSRTSTVGVRIPDHPMALALLRLSGPLAVTSANLSDHPNPSTAQDVFAQLEGRIPLILDGGRTAGGIPSTVVNCMGSAPKVLRSGPISEEDILDVWNH
jgi:L-threonylcarbamoyladenylate synthase